MQNVTQGAETTCGFIALIGAPNAGKSTLLNALVGQKIAIVSHKVQTTRTRLTGIAIEGQSQLVFVDTPGIFAPKRRLDRAMVAAAWEGAQDADQVVFLIDAAKGIRADEQKIIDGLSEAGRKVIVALNKVDSVKRDRLLALAQAVDAAGVAAEIFMISAYGGWRAGSENASGKEFAQKPVALSRRSDHRYHHPCFGGGNHPRKDFFTASSGTALWHHRRDGKMGRPQGRVHRDSSGDPCVAGWP